MVALSTSLRVIWTWLTRFFDSALCVRMYATTWKNRLIML